LNQTTNCGAFNNQHDQPTSTSAFCASHPAMDDKAVSVTDLEEQRKHILKELRMRKLADARARREEEERQHIEAGEGKLYNS